jgi:hypothetical protein
MNRHDSLSGLEALIASFLCAQRRQGAKVAKKTKKKRDSSGTSVKKPLLPVCFAALGPFASWRASFLPLGGQ